MALQAHSRFPWCSPRKFQAETRCQKKGEILMPSAINLTGNRYGRLVVIGCAGNNAHKQRTWLCQCDCGETNTVVGGSLVSGLTRSCGCLKNDTIRAIRLKHGHSSGRKRSTEYTAWKNMKIRCGYPDYKAFHHYGGRGITICKRWLNSFENFLADMGPKPFGLTLDRINTNGNYRPSNCRWATWKQQRANRRPSK